jgi:hypothetical protein
MKIKLLNCLKALIFLSLFVLISLNVYSVEYLDTRGRDFWLTFLPNSHMNPTTSTTDSLFIFIAAEQPTTGLIEYYDRVGKYYKKPFSITQPNSLYTFKLQFFNYELWGYKTEYNYGSRNQSEMVSNLAFHITSVDEISVYGHSQARLTSDAFLVMPTDVIDKNYFVASYNSDGNKLNGSNGGGPTPSQFAVIATEDNTNVIINPKVQTQYNGTTVQKITLNKGEVYLVQAKINSSNYNLDLTGTSVDADKPVAVFGGEQKALIPYSTSNSAGSRDCLIEQIPPTKVWGKNAFITPFKQPSGSTNINNDLFRIIAAYDNTTISINNAVAANLNKGEFYQNILTAPATVTANAPFMLVQYKKTSGGSNLGDPFMLVVPPKEQFMRAYTTINVQAYEYFGKVYEEQYITIVIAQNAISSFMLDGNSVNPGLFNAIPNSTYSYANIVVSDGVHNTKADSVFGIYIYGYGYANSFGYTGGMSFQPIDFQAPQMSSIDSCYKVSGMIYDSTISDSGILNCFCPDSSKHNCTVNVNKISSNGRTSTFDATLIDKKYDGSFTIIATDSIQQTNIKTFDIKGFTLGINGSELSDNHIKFDTSLQSGTTKCFKIQLHNYGKFDQTIKDFTLLNKAFFNFTTNLPLIIKPGEIDTVTVCFYTDIDSIYIDTFSIIGDCGVIKGLADFKINTRNDKFPPNITSIDSCFTVSGIVSDSTQTDFGLQSCFCPDSSKHNSTVNVDIISSNGKTSKFNARLIDKKQDGSFTIIATDSSSKITSKTFDIKGFTLGINGSELSDSLIKFEGKLKTGSSKCYQIPIHNYGKFNQTIIGYNILNISVFNLSPNLPLVIKPGEIDTLTICFSADVDSIYIDKLSIIEDCGDLKGLAEFKIETGHDKLPPVFTTNQDSCSKNFVVYVSDSTSWDSGINQIQILDKNNCNIDIITNTIYTAKISINIINSSEDMYYRILVQDSSGHQLFIADTIKGNSLKIFSGSNADTSNVLQFGHREIGTRTTDSLILFNKGTFSIILNNIILRRNIHFSIPQSQFPLVLNPYDSTKLFICFYPTKVDSIPYHDTLLIDSYCINQIEILKGFGDGIIDTSTSKCNFDLIFTSNEIPDDFIVSAIYPNPLSGKGKINIGISEKSVIKIDIYNYAGNYIKTISDFELLPGKYELTISTEELSEGLYFIKVSKDNQTIIRSMIVEK